ncbi:DUF3887 domain-containing protein [Aphanothece sacrum]|uniref:NAD-dependent dehydratase n=1 Tax=Aphanothece sacrum FPU1 TaxID=1920663 RepID=A0A401ILU6_APHSA|nr:DUF3887 domain-containing protein [Aphanothece sacrum]GBF82208.1 NAD-dependent dehydratase [Aphanothece sacrum FPU1]GBF87254.1 NAD-dependent dehydratase [Aphanothece sacrum FPU3]
MSGSLSLFKQVSLSLLVLGLMSIVSDVSVKAQKLKPPSTLQMTQSSDTAKNQGLQQKAAQVINLLSQKKYDEVRKLISPVLASELTTAQMSEIWEGLIAVTGPVKQQLDSRVIPTVNADLVVINTQFDKKTDEFIVTFNKEGEVIGVDFPTVASIEEIAEIVVNSVSANNFTRARGYLHPFLKTEIFPQQLQTSWQRIQQENGLFERIVSTKVRLGSSVDKSNVVIVEAEFEKANRKFFIIFDENSRIIGINLVQ